MAEKIVIKNVHIVNPDSNDTPVMDIVIENGIISDVCKEYSGNADRFIDCNNEEVNFSVESEIRRNIINTRTL